MKKLLLSLITLSVILTGCGKDNKTSTGSTAATAATTTTTTGTITGTGIDAVKSQLNAIIDNNQFASSTNSYGYSVRVEKYSFTYECVKKDGWFGIDYTKCGTNKQFVSSTKASDMDLAAKKAELKTIVNDMVNYRANGSTVEILTSANKNYTIYLAYPIQANPVFHYDLANKNGFSTQLAY